MDDGAIIIVPIVMGTLFIGLPWLIFHYITRWKTAATLTGEDEKLLDDLHEVARRLEDRMVTIERIMAAEIPAWRQVAADPAGLAIDDTSSVRRISK